jgi:hypothetical protein
MKEEVHTLHLLECSQSHGEFEKESATKAHEVRTQHANARDLKAQLKKAEEEEDALQTEFLAFSNTFHRSQQDAQGRLTDFSTEFTKGVGIFVEKLRGVVDRVRRVVC